MNVIYARYNRHRLPPFQIETSIVDLNGAKTVVKKALTPEAGNHIQGIRSGYDLIQSNLNAGGLALPRLMGFDGSSISFQYIEGESLDRLLFRSFRGGDRPSFFKIIDDYCALLKKSFNSPAQPNLTAKIGEVFGLTDRVSCKSLSRTHPGLRPPLRRRGTSEVKGQEVMIPSLEGYAKRGVGLNAAEADFCTQLDPKQLDNGGGWLPLAAVDAVFENIIISGESYYLIDNEWVFAGGVPAAFVIFRSLFYFHKVKYFEIGIEKWVPFEELLARCQILPEQAARYRAMDEKFQAYVYGPGRCYKYKDQYKKRQISVYQMEQTIEHQRAVVRKYHDAIMQKERVINEIVNSFGWRLWRKIACVINFLCPAGSRRRRLADRLVASFKSRRK